MIWTCDNCGRQIKGEIVLPVWCSCRAWPHWAKLVKRLRHDGERGVGDTVQRIAAKFGGEKFKLWAGSMGIPCGCTERQAKWNRLYPY